jgi:hypothetical protein
MNQKDLQKIENSKEQKRKPSILNLIITLLFCAITPIFFVVSLNHRYRYLSGTGFVLFGIYGLIAKGIWLFDYQNIGPGEFLSSNISKVISFFFIFMGLLLSLATYFLIS